VATLAAVLLPLGLVQSLSPAAAVPGPVGQGFTVTPGDLAFILKQIKIAEHHSTALANAQSGLVPNPDPLGDPDYCQSMIGPNSYQVPDALTSYGLRTVDGSCNNLKVGSTAGVLNAHIGAADATFPRLTAPVFQDAEPITASFPVGAPGPTTYRQKSGSVVDSQPRLISNLIADQTSTNPAAVAAALHPVRSQSNTPTAVPCTTDPQLDAVPPVAAVPSGCTPTHQTLFIPNVTTDVGLSPPYNSLFTFFGQFFDHGVDQTVKGGSGTVFVPLRSDDPLIAGADHVLGTPDDLPASMRFMVLTRATNQPGPDRVLGTSDDVQDARNTDTPWVDNSQTYTSHPSHQVFLREYADNQSSHPVPTGRMLGGLAAGQTYAGSPDGTTGMATWASVKRQSALLLGIQLVDLDALDVPMLATDPYGRFIPGPARGLPQFVTAHGLVEADRAANGGRGTLVPADVRHMDTPFLTDIAHNADPSPQDSDHNPGTPPVAPVPDSNSTPSADFASQPAGTYDDEMLGAHFVCGDGRCNENIALSAIHQVFESEHNRLVVDIKNVLANDTSADGVAALAEWQLPTTADPSGWNGERLFQAARFINEMEYQHTVFEEFARKVQPAIRVFHAYSPDIDPAIDAEFAAAVYRFGHSMLDDNVARTNEAPDGTKTDNSLPLLGAFLNPPAYFDSGKPGSPYTPQQAAGAIVMGSSDQIGNELDEFMTETLRNNLLGLPLDLATLNLTRAREVGIPPLNTLRRQLFGQTNDGQLAPYTSWADFGQHLKHRESLVNFVAAYGTHPSITSQTSIAGKRAAATLLVNPTNPVDPAIPADAADFVLGTGAWANLPSGVTTTGLDSVDLWVGGLAEATNLNGGLLGSTFNYVFQTQLENLQDGDRLYYLARTPGLNLLSQLEGNSFAEMIGRNTDGTHSLKADSFATADCRFELGHLEGTAAGYAAHGSTVADDPTTGCNESLLLQRNPDGTIQYRAVNPVNPTGINGQSVYNGTSSADRVIGGVDSDTIWGGPGKDVIDGGGGPDVVLGGDGADIVTDSDGADILKGGPGNDAVDGGPGGDLLLGGDGQDFINGGSGDNETFAGPGDDFVIAGLGADTVLGDGGDDWMEGGTGTDNLDGDHGAPFLDDPGERAPGADVMIGQPGDNNYNAEGGDDIMSTNAALDRFIGAGGFDWAIHQYDTVPATDDMNINNGQGGLGIVVAANRDRWQEVEGLSGSSYNDVIKGTDVIPRTVGGAGFIGCDVIDQAGVDRIAGLSALLPPASLTTDPATVVAVSAAGSCPVHGNVWGEGDILLGGAGSDTVTGRGGDDIIDGDRELTVRISVRTNPADPATEIGSTDLMEHTYRAGSTHTLQQDVFAGVIDPGQLVAVREITSPATVPPTDCGATAPLNCDTVVMSGPLSSYSLVFGPDSVKVSQTGPLAAGQLVSDGTDTLRNVEQIQFTDQRVSLVASTSPGAAPAPTIGTATAGVGSATVRWTPPSATGGLPIGSFDVLANPAVGAATLVTGVSRTATSRIVSGLTPNVAYTFQVRVVNAAGAGDWSVASNAVVPSVPPLPPAAPTSVSASPRVVSAVVSWTPPAANGGPAITSYQIVTTPASVPTLTITDPSATSATVPGLLGGVAYTFQVRAINADGSGPLSTPSPTIVVTSLSPPSTPTSLLAIATDREVILSWTDGATATSSHVVQVKSGRTIVRTDTIPGDLHSAVISGLTNGTSYSFTVQAVNAAGSSAFSVSSPTVKPVGTPGAPVQLTPTRGAKGGALTLTAAWDAPTSNGGSKVTGYVVTARRMAADGVTVVSSTTATAGASARKLQLTLPAGTYTLTVAATNAFGTGTASAPSVAISPR
jgi:Ca2+-binding RTX toxin-like protein